VEPKKSRVKNQKTIEKTKKKAEKESNESGESVRRRFNRSISAVHAYSYKRAKIRRQVYLNLAAT